MALTKKIQALTNQGRTIYATIQRESDGFLMNDADGTFSAAPADFFLTLTEDGTLKGFYSASENRTAWTDGTYNYYIYHQLGGSPTIATDTPLGLETVQLASDAYIVPTEATDPWSTALPGAYGVGTAGKIVGDNIDATVSSRATNAGVVSALFATVTEGTLTFIQAFRLSCSALFAKASGMDTTTGTFRDFADTKDRIVVTQDEFGNRTNFTTRDGT